MKTAAKLPTGLMFALAISAHAAPFVTYSEDFNNAGTGNKPLSQFDTGDRGNWNGNFSSSATTYDRDSIVSGTSPVFSGQTVKFLFVNTTNTADNGVPIFVWTDGLSAGAAGDFNSVQFGLENNNTTTENVRITLQIEGAWFVTNSTYNGSDLTNDILSTAGSTWSTLNFISGTSMSIGDTIALPTAGTITGVGIYDEHRTAQIRLDNLAILTNISDPYQTWDASYPLADLSDPTADNDDDGLSNFKEFAFGLDPTSGASVNPITEASQLRSGTFSYTRLAESGLTYTVWASTDLQDWGTEPVSVTEDPGPPVDGVVTVVVTLNTPPTADKLFVKVMATSVL